MAHKPVTSLPCVILAGGVGTRMRPIAERIPKALIPVKGRPFAELQLEWLRSQGTERVVYSIGFLGDMLRVHVGDGTRFGLRVDYVEDGDELRGTAGALRVVVDSGLVTDAFMVLYGDSYLTVDLRRVEQAFHNSALPALMTVLRNENRWEASNAIVRDGRVVLYDKARPDPVASEMAWIDYGLSVLTRQVILEAVPAGVVVDLADVMRDLSSAGRLAAYEVTHRFYEIGSPQGLAELEALLSTSLKASQLPLVRSKRPRPGEDVHPGVTNMDESPG